MGGKHTEHQLTAWLCTLYRFVSGAFIWCSRLKALSYALSQSTRLSLHSTHEGDEAERRKIDHPGGLQIFRYEGIIAYSTDSHKAKNVFHK